MSQIREEVSFTKARLMVRGEPASRGKAKRAGHVPYFKPNIPLPLIEPQDSKCVIPAAPGFVFSIQ